MENKEKDYLDEIAEAFFPKWLSDEDMNPYWVIAGILLLLNLFF